jgi:hypothetical protein
MRSWISHINTCQQQNNKKHRLYQIQSYVLFTHIWYKLGYNHTNKMLAASHNRFLTLIQFPTRTRQSTPLYPAEEPCFSYQPLNTSEVSQCTVKAYTHIYTPARAHTYIKYKPLFSHRLNVYLTLSMCYLYTRVHTRAHTHTHTLFHIYIVAIWKLHPDDCLSLAFQVTHTVM